MRLSIGATVIGASVLIALMSFIVWPQIDLTVSSLFTDHQNRFFWAHVTPLIIVSRTAFWGARALGVVLMIGTLVAYVGRRSLLGLTRKSWLFLFVALLLGPGLVANVIFKDNFGRARPRSVIEFGGNAQFTSPFSISDACEKNCSFVSGDAAFGFYLPSFAYAVSLRRSRRAFWGLTAFGSIFGLGRIASGAHFLSDVLFAGVFVLASTALLHAALFGPHATKERWRFWFSRRTEPV